MSAQHLDRVRELLAGHGTVTLATVANGRAWAATVFYASDADLNLYFVTDLRTRHGHALRQDSRVAAAIDRDVSTWGEVIGLQLEGRATVLEGDGREQALATYLGRFPDVRRLFDAPRGPSETVIADRLRQTPFWRLTPDWIRLIDSTRGFGWKWETKIETGAGTSVSENRG